MSRKKRRKRTQWNGRGQRKSNGEDHEAQKPRSPLLPLLGPQMVIEAVARLLEEGTLPTAEAVASIIEVHFPHLPEIRAEILEDRITQLMDRIVRDHERGIRRINHGRKKGNEAQLATNLLGGLVPAPQSGDLVPDRCGEQTGIEALVAEPTGPRSEVSEIDPLPPRILGPTGEPFSSMDPDG